MAYFRRFLGFAGRRGAAFAAALASLAALAAEPALFQIRQGDRIGLIDGSGKLVVPAEFSSAPVVGDPYIRVQKGSRTAYYGHDGSLAIAGIKVLLQPLMVWLLARLLALPPMETQVVVLLASIGVGANVYLMSRQFKVLEGAVAGSLVLSTCFAAVSTPLILTLVQSLS